MSELELKVKQELGVLNWNFEEINQILDIELKKYQTLVFTEDTMNEAKKTRAGLNNIAKQINDKKVSVKNEFCAPYFQFEEQAKKIIGKIKNASDLIDVQIKSFEEKKKEEKRALIEDYYNQPKVGLKYIKLEQIFDEKWLNKGTSEKSWKEQLSGKIETIKTNVAIIQSMTEKDTKLLGQLYLENLDLNSALQRYEAIQAQTKALEPQNDTEVQIYYPIENNAKTPPELSQNKVLDVDVKEIYVRAFKVRGTKEQIIALGNFMNENNIEFEKIEL